MEDFNDVESDNEFNPAPAEDSGDEKQTQSRARQSSSRARSRDVDVDADDDDGEDDAKVALSPGKVSGAGGDAEGDDDVNGEADDDANGEVEGENGEDDEGEGEDLGAGDDDDEDDEDEDEEEDEADAVGRPRKRQKRGRRNQFLDVEAEVDDEEDEEEEDEDIPDEVHPDDLLDRHAANEHDDRAHRELDRDRELVSQVEVEKLAAAMKEKYGRNRAAQSDAAVIPQRLLLPTVEDPTIWAVHCKPGKEKEVVMSIMKRIMDRGKTREPLQITTCFERGEATGFFYVEARRQADVMEAVDGIQNAWPRKAGGEVGTMLISISEMPDLLKTRKTKILEVGTYVRIRKPQLYHMDLGQVDYVESNGVDITVKVVPRLDYGANEDLNAALDANGKRKRGFAAQNKGPRPPPKLFNSDEAKKRDPRNLNQVRMVDKKHWTYKGKDYINGFLYMDMKVNQVYTDSVEPRLEEVTMFAAGQEDGTENLDLHALSQSLKASTSSSDYLPGDRVEIYQGEQSGLAGRAVKVHGDIVTIKVSSEGPLKGKEVEAPKKGLRKAFNEGDHVKVIGGKYMDEVGMVTRVKDDRITLVTDANTESITVFSKDLREAADSGGTTGTMKWDLYDLIMLDAATAAIITQLDRESCRILDQNGNSRTILNSHISGRIDPRHGAIAQDANGNEMRTGDLVNESGGEGRTGKLLHIHRQTLFILDRGQTANGGIWVTRTQNVMSVAAKGASAINTGRDLSKMNPAMQINGGAPQPMMPPPRIFGRDKMIGKTVSVRKGVYKGLLGIVKDTTETEARVELHTKNKLITVNRDLLIVKDPATGATLDINGRFGGGRGRGSTPSGGQTRYGGATPGARVPDWGGARTPMGASGSRTPAWGMSGSRTPAAAAGGRTPAPAWGRSGGDGGKTPAWGQGDGSRTVNPYTDGSRTSYGGSGGAANVSVPLFFSAESLYLTTPPRTKAWGSSSRTPFHPSAGVGSRTPAYQPNQSAYNAPTPGAGPYSAPTPGGAPTPAGAHTPGAHGAYSAPTPYDAPTPGYGGAPTPAAGGMGMDQPTPGARYGGAYGTPAAAPTPGAYPETPGGFADDDGPRWE
ncbi:transcription elongation factor Spt5 [Aulographum hederae CBS 113979]|uniref:Transcription elongation factor SPT5 n=1 Tax=Aulographum hederae CBS 113979 TaxID=1176131 RepID=A0A6G1HB62_9PEZI|nr:transcription elongation factor Spt5 [Aulographum hederae CBS 113979]